MSSTTETAVSKNAIQKALLLLLDDRRLRNGYEQDQTIDQASTITLQLKERIQELKLIHEAFDYHVRCEIAAASRQQNALAPIHRLPAEIFRNIFLLRVSDSYESRIETSLIFRENLSRRDPEETRPESEYSVASNMAAVCSHWYNLTHSMPQLWSYLDSRESLDVAKVLLRRSRQSPLHISCHAKVNSPHELAFMVLVIPHLHRWKSFDTHTKDLAFFTNLDVEGYSAPLLERFICHGNPRHQLTRRISSLILEQSPKLRDLHMVTSPYPSAGDVLSQLGLGIFGSNGMFGYKTDDYEVLLSACPKLEALSLYGDQRAVADIHPFSVRLPNLKSIYLRHLSPAVTNTILLSVLPEHESYPFIKVVGRWDLTGFEGVLERPDNLLYLVLHSIINLSVTESPDYSSSNLHQVRTQRKLRGSLVPSLEITDRIDGAVDSVLASLICSDGSSKLKDIELEIGQDLDAATIAKHIHLCPDLEHLTITTHLWRWIIMLPIFIEQLTFLGSNGAGDIWVGPQLKRLSLKGVAQLGPVIEILSPKDGESLSGFLAQLSVLDIQYVKGTIADVDEEEKRELSWITICEDIELNMTSVAKRT